MLKLSKHGQKAKKAARRKRNLQFEALENRILLSADLGISLTDLEHQTEPRANEIIESELELTGFDSSEFEPETISVDDSLTKLIANLAASNDDSTDANPDAGTAEQDPDAGEDGLDVSQPTDETEEKPDQTLSAEALYLAERMMASEIVIIDSAIPEFETLIKEIENAESIDLDSIINAAQIQETAALPVADFAADSVKSEIESADNFVYGTIQQQLNTNVDREIKIFVLDSTKDGIAQISSILDYFQEIAAVHLISHGSAGALFLGNNKLNTQQIKTNEQQLKRWGSALSANGDLLLYGCNVAEGELGLEFIEELAATTDADVSASIDLTGNSELGGDWDLEVTTGITESLPFFYAMDPSVYSFVLSGSYSGTSNGSGVTNQSFSGTQDFTDGRYDKLEFDGTSGTLTIKFTKIGSVEITNGSAKITASGIKDINVSNSSATIDVLFDNGAQFGGVTVDLSQGNVGSKTLSFTTNTTNPDAFLAKGETELVKLTPQLGNVAGEYTLKVGAKTATLKGFQGAKIIGGLGRDDFSGSNTVAVNEIFLGGKGNDKISGGKGDDSLTGGKGEDFLEGNDGVDTLFGNTGDDVLEGGAGNDSGPSSYTATSAADLLKNGLHGGDGNDRISGDAGDDWLFGEDGADILSGGEGEDILVGGDGNDRYIFENNWGQDTVLEESGEGKDILDFSAVTSNLSIDVGVAGSPSLDDYITVSSGINSVNSTGHIETIIGGTGTNTYVVTGFFVDIYSPDGLLNKTLNIQNTLADGADPSAVLDLSLVTQNLSMVIEKNDNNVKGNKVTITYDRIGSLTDGKLVITNVAEIMTGNGNNDITFKDGARLIGNLTTGSGNDSIIMKRGAVLGGNLTAGDGNDTFTLGDIGTEIVGDLDAGTGINSIIFEGTSNYAGTHTGTLDATDASSLAAVDAQYYANVSVSLGMEFSMDNVAGQYPHILGVVSGIQSVTGGEFKDAIFGTADDNILNGGAGIDRLFGNDGTDTLIGGAGNDYLDGGDNPSTTNLQILNGGTGDDILISGNGNDKLIGGKGKDIFVFENDWGQDIIESSILDSKEDILDFSKVTSSLTYSIASNEIKVGDVQASGFVRDAALFGASSALPGYEKATGTFVLGADTLTVLGTNITGKGSNNIHNIVTGNGEQSFFIGNSWSTTEIDATAAVAAGKEVVLDFSGSTIPLKFDFFNDQATQWISVPAGDDLYVKYGDNETTFTGADVTPDKLQTWLRDTAEEEKRSKIPPFNVTTKDYDTTTVQIETGSNFTGKWRIDFSSSEGASLENVKTLMFSNAEPTRQILDVPSASDSLIVLYGNKRIALSGAANVTDVALQQALEDISFNGGLTKPLNNKVTVKDNGDGTWTVTLPSDAETLRYAVLSAAQIDGIDLTEQWLTVPAGTKVLTVTYGSKEVVIVGDNGADVTIDQLENELRKINGLSNVDVSIDLVGSHQNQWTVDLTLATTPDRLHYRVSQTTPLINAGHTPYDDSDRLVRVKVSNISGTSNLSINSVLNEFGKADYIQLRGVDANTKIISGRDSNFYRARGDAIFTGELIMLGGAQFNSIPGTETAIPVGIQVEHGVDLTEGLGTDLKNTIENFKNPRVVDLTKGTIGTSTFSDLKGSFSLVDQVKTELKNALSPNFLDDTLATVDGFSNIILEPRDGLSLAAQISNIKFGSGLNLLRGDGGANLFSGKLLRPAVTVMSGGGGGDTYKMGNVWGFAAAIEPPDLTIGGQPIPEALDTLDFSSFIGNVQVDVYNFDFIRDTIGEIPGLENLDTEDWPSISTNFLLIRGVDFFGDVFNLFDNDSLQGWIDLIADFPGGIGLSNMIAMDIESLIGPKAGNLNITLHTGASLRGTVKSGPLGGYVTLDYSDYYLSEGAVSLPAQDFENPSDANGDYVYELTLIATDEDGNTANTSWTVTMNDVVTDNAATISSPDTARFAENATGAVLAVTADEAITSYDLVGSDDDGLFSIDSSGLITFLIPPDFESATDFNADNIYRITVAVEDSDGNTTAQTIDIDVTDVAETGGATITSSYATTFAENATGTVLAVTADEAITTYDLVGSDDDGLFSIDSSGLITFLIPPDFESPTDFN
ncbi:MAG: Ca2+-binding RTX toxin-like protein, partial [Gammaproteobacteria bacterium]